MQRLYYPCEDGVKLRSPLEVVSRIKSGTHLFIGMALGDPALLLKALSDRLRNSDLSDIKLWYFHSMPTAAEMILSYDLMGRVHPHCMFMRPIERGLMRRGEIDDKKTVNFVLIVFSDAPKLVSRHIELDTFLITVSPMDEHGYFSLGTNNDYASTAAPNAKKTVIEVNENMPRVSGDPLIHISELDAIVENLIPLFEKPDRNPSKGEMMISKTIAEHVPDEACLQMDIGALPNAVCAQLKDSHDLGIHTELLSFGLVELIECGAVANRRKITFPGRTVYKFAVSSKRMCDLINNNPSINSHPVNIVNDPRHIAKNPNVVSISVTLQVDLSGVCNSETLARRQYSGAGGQLDFVRGAHSWTGGRSIIACRSTAKGDTVSCIVPILNGPVTTPRNDVDTIVTEYGVAHLIGFSGEERAKALIKIAHPKHGDALTDVQKKR